MERMSFNLEGKIAIVTGAGRGMGRAVALGLGREGARVVVADMDAATAAAAAAAIRDVGGEAHAVTADVGYVDQIQRIFGETLDRFGDLDILINNAGFHTTTNTVDYTEENWDRHMDVDLKALFFCAQAAARIMIPKRRGKIVNFASTSSFVSSRNPKVAYDTAKGGVRQMTVSLAGEMAKYGIHVNAVAPGTILTDMNRHTLATDEQKASAIARIPFGRLGTPEDVVGPVLFLCSPAADYVVGHTLVVDGGWLLY